MSYQKEYNVVCLGDTKQAALFFDKIIPVSFLINMVGNPQIQTKHEEYKNKVLKSGMIWPEEFKEFKEFIKEDDFTEHVEEHREYFDLLLHPTKVIIDLIGEDPAKDLDRIYHLVYYMQVF